MKNVRVLYLLFLLLWILPVPAVTLDIPADAHPTDREWSPDESAYLEVQGGKLFYETAGKGDAIVFIHDGLIHREVWDQQFRTFSKNYEVVRYDRRGYGRSTVPEAPYSDMEDLESIIEALSIDSATLVGMSAGGRLAIDYTLAHPEKVSSLVLVGAVVSGLGYTDHFFTRGGHRTSVDMSDTDAAITYWVMDDPWEFAKESTEAKARAMSLLKANPQNLNNAKFGLRRNPDRQALGALGEIGIPVLIVAGEYDIPDVHAHAGAIQAGIKGSRRIVISNAGHIVPLEQPDAFDRAMMSFLKFKDFSMILASEGTTAAVDYFHKMREAEPNAVLFEEGSLNGLAYQALFTGDIEGAIALFKLNVEAYPDSWNVYDSLAEAYAAAGQNDLAIKNYRRSLELNPGNTNAVERLKALGVDR